MTEYDLRGLAVGHGSVFTWVRRHQVSEVAHSGKAVTRHRFEGDPAREAQLVRSLTARACAWTSALVVMLAAGSATARAASAVPRPLAQSAPLDMLGAPVGLTAVLLGVVGMATGVLRRRKPVQPENQRRN